MMREMSFLQCIIAFLQCAWRFWERQMAFFDGFHRKSACETGKPACNATRRCKRIKSWFCATWDLWPRGWRVERGEARQVPPGA
jgi:hypothetical protein